MSKMQLVIYNDGMDKEAFDRVCYLLGQLYPGSLRDSETTMRLPTIPSSMEWSGRLLYSHEHGELCTLESYRMKTLRKHLEAMIDLWNQRTKDSRGLDVHCDTIFQTEEQEYNDMLRRQMEQSKPEDLIRTGKIVLTGWKPRVIAVWDTVREVLWFEVAAIPENKVPHDYPNFAQVRDWCTWVDAHFCSTIQEANRLILSYCGRKAKGFDISLVAAADQNKFWCQKLQVDDVVVQYQFPSTYTFQTIRKKLKSGKVDIDYGTRFLPNGNEFKKGRSLFCKRLLPVSAELRELVNSDMSMLNTLEQFTRLYLGIPTLDTRMRDGLDFHEVSIKALVQSYRAAMLSGARSIYPDLPDVYQWIPEEAAETFIKRLLSHVNGSSPRENHIGISVWSLCETIVMAYKAGARPDTVAVGTWLFAVELYHVMGDFFHIIDKVLWGRSFERCDLWYLEVSALLDEGDTGRIRDILQEAVGADHIFEYDGIRTQEMLEELSGFTKENSKD